MSRNSEEQMRRNMARRRLKQRTKSKRMKNEEQDIRAGDGIVMTHSAFDYVSHLSPILARWGNRGIVRARVTPGRVDGTPTDDDDTLVAVIADFKHAKQVRVPVGSFRRETFFEHMTRPTGFGRTSWDAFAFIQAICIGGAVASVLYWNDGGWIGACLVALTEAALVLGTWMNYTRRWV